MNQTQRVEITSPPLMPAPTLDELELHELALEWSLAEPIVIDSAEDIKSRVNWQDRLEPFHHQVQNLMTFCRRLPVSLIADDVGLGKTISAGLILSELMVRNRVSRTLVVCPSILGPQWIEELESKFGIFGRFVTGSDLDSALRGQADVVATTYHSISPRLKRIEPGMFDMLILDEAHKLRNLYGTRSPPRMAERIRDTLESRLFKYVVMLTATPIQNRLWDLYSLIDCLAVAKGHRNPFGPADEFAWKYIADSKSTARKLKPGAKEEFQKILRQYLVRTRRTEVRLVFPSREVKLFRISPNSLDSQLQELVSSQIEGMNGLQQISLLIAMMSSPQALVAQLRNMADRDSRFAAFASEVEVLVADAPPPSKVKGLLQLIDQLRADRPDDWRLVVFTTRKETQRIIGDHLAERDIPHGFIKGGRPAENVNAVKAYTAQPPTIHVIVSTDAGAEGVNLQAGNVVVNFDLPWNPMIVEQRIGRVQRLASKHGHVVIVNIAVAGSPEERVVARLMEKLQTIVDTVGDIEAILEASPGGNDDASSFEGKVRDLVLKSLRGQDTDKATAQAAASIQEAKDLFEQQRAEIDTKLGDLNELHSSGPNMPRLTPLTPSVPYDEFVKAALLAEGYSLIRDDDGCYSASLQSGRSERITFNERQWRELTQAGVFMGRSPKLYAPGKPHFERLVQRWLDRAGHHTLDTRPLTTELVDSFLTEWTKQIPGSQIQHQQILKTHAFTQGRTCLRATADNAVDSYEKLINVEVVPDGHNPINQSGIEVAPVVRDQLRPMRKSDDAYDIAKTQLAADDDVAEFSKFYQARLTEELKSAKGERERVRKVKNDLEPSIHAVAAAYRGWQYESCVVAAEFTIDGHSGYSLTLELCPATDQVIRGPEAWDTCEESGQKYPAEFLESCVRSKRRVLRHLTIISDVSGRRALERFTTTCPRTGRVALDDEFLTSDLSGKSAVGSEFVESMMTGRKGLPDEMETCAFTGSVILQDEVVISDVSGKPFRKDQLATSVVSGVKGHSEEFVACSVTNETLLPEETETSDVSGLIVRSELAQSSERSPYRIGLPKELVVCAHSKRRLLIDEVGKCNVTGKLVDSELLAASDESGRLALESELLTCEATGVKILPDESVWTGLSGLRVARRVAVRSVVSGEFAMPSDIVRCEITGDPVLPNELITSSVSGLRFRIDQKVSSLVSHRIAHRSEGVRCEYSGRQLLSDEAATSDFSGKTTATSELTPSEKSGRLGTVSELGVCAESGRRLLRDELEWCVVSHVLVDRDHLVASDRSGRLALDRRLVVCAESGQRLLPAETERCAVTGKTVDRQLLRKSDLSDAFALPAVMVKCDVSGMLCLPSELEECGVTGDLAIPSEIETCVITGTRARRDKLVKSALSGRWLLPKEARQSIRDDSILCPDEASWCHWNEGWMKKSEIKTCSRTNLTFSAVLLDPSTGQFRGINHLFSGKHQSMQYANDLVGWLKQQEPRQLKTVENAWKITSKKGGISIVWADLHMALGFIRRNALIVVVHKPELQIIGRVTLNSKGHPGWKEFD